MLQTLPDKLIEKGKIEGEIKGATKTMLKVLSWTSPDLATKYKKDILSAKTQEELAVIEEKIKAEIQQSKNS